MDFHSFARQIGGASSDPLLGSDPVPSGQDSKGSTCALTTRIWGKSGVTYVQRLGVSYSGPAATIPATVWVFDEKSLTWITTGAGNLTANDLVRIDLICPIDDGVSNGSVDVYVQVVDPGGLQNGVYTFLVAPDSSVATTLTASGGPAVNVAVTNFPPTFQSAVVSSVLPTGAASAAKQDTGNTLLSGISTELGVIDGKTPNLGQALAAGSVPSVLPLAQENSLRDVSDRAGRLLGHVAVDSSALPSGASTSALQGAGLPGALTAGGGVKAGLVDALPAGSNVIGHVVVDSAASVAVTSLPAIPAGTNTIGAVTAPGAAALALDATLTGGTAKSINRGGAKGATTAADITSSGQGADHQGLDVLARDASGNALPAMDVASRKGFVAVTDGTNTQAVKAASIAAQATDPSAVVALSPNSPIPAGSNAIGSVAVTSLPAVTGTVTANQGTAGATANAWPSKVTDGTNVAVVKAGGTSAQSSDASMVVALSPNSSIPAGSNLIGSAVQRPPSSSADVTTAHNSGAATLVQKEDGVKGAAGNLFSFLAYNSSTSPRWIYVYDALTATGTAIHVLQVPPKDLVSGTFGFGSTDFPYGRRFSTGLSWAASTTPPGTAFNAAGAEIYAEMEYV